jgi:hypothetical protein
MAFSQFTVYSSYDAGGPGFITGSAGSFINVLDQCLCSGYSGHAAAGWSKVAPIASNFALFQQGAGVNSAPFGLYLGVTDNGATFPTTAAEAAFYGAHTSSGGGQFPNAIQLTTWGRLIVRKSATADSTTLSPWYLFADARTIYMFIATGDTTLGLGGYMDFGFGDIYSLYGSSDTERVFIAGRVSINNASVGCGLGGLDELNTPYVSTVGGNSGAPGAAGYSGRYMADWYGHGGGVSNASIPIWICGDLGKVSTQLTTSVGVPLAGNIPRSNMADNSVYVAPVFIYDNPTTWAIRGRMRGFYHVCHSASSFQGGRMTFSGAGDYAGKTFMILSPGQNGGAYCIETSNTVETN